MNEGFSIKPKPSVAEEEPLRNAIKPEEMLDESAEKSGMPPPPPEQFAEAKIALKERDIKNPEELSAREHSKEHMAAERKELAVKVRQERIEARDKLSELRVRVNLLKNKLENSTQSIEAAAQELEQFREQRSERANSLAGRFRSFLHIETAQDKALESSVVEKENMIEATEAEKLEAEKELEDSMSQLVDADVAMASIKEKIAEHYVEAGEKMQKTVEQTMLRNNVFFVHTINEHPELRHNANSNVSAEASFEDDLDILLALEPSLSASTVVVGADENGMVSGLWSKTGGVLLSGGSISAAEGGDIGTISTGIKSRWAGGASENLSVKNLDQVTQIRRARQGEIGGYNELVVNNPEVSGYFKSGAVDETGQFWANGLDTKTELIKLHQQYQKNPNTPEYADSLNRFNKSIASFKQRFDLIKSKGLPFYVMSPDRRLFECLKVNDDGSLETGAELIPEHAATGRAGLAPEKRKEIGQKLLQKELFRDQRTQNEARQIIEGLESQG